MPTGKTKFIQQCHEEYWMGRRLQQEGAVDQQSDNAGRERNCTSVEYRGDRELVVTRTLNAPRSSVYRAWISPELFQRWWVPRTASGISLVSCEMDVVSGGKYRLEFAIGGSDTMTFYGKYLEVVPNERIVWTNDEGEDGAVTTVTLQDQGAKTLLNFHESYPSKEALEDALQGSAAALPEQLEQLDELLCTNG
jgi:uncharacterized protein YndB with AHSA1/START domain